VDDLANNVGRSLQKLLVLNGPNLNLLGMREPAVYGATGLAELEAQCVADGLAHGFAVTCLQSNAEHVLIEALHQAGREATPVVFNPGGYSHTSVALRDAIKGAGVTVIEVHISNIHAREEFRHFSYMSAVAAGVICGFGINGYALAIAAAAALGQNRKPTA
jgi:3-dehydroquinate dehydratase II